MSKIKVNIESNGLNSGTKVTDENGNILSVSEVEWHAKVGEIPTLVLHMRTERIDILNTEAELKEDTSIEDKGDALKLGISIYQRRIAELQKELHAYYASDEYKRKEAEILERNARALEDLGRAFEITAQEIQQAKDPFKTVRLLAEAQGFQFVDRDDLQGEKENNAGK